MDSIVFAYVEEDTPTGGPEAPGNSEPPPARPPARYTKSTLRQTLQLMGCKPRLAHRASEKVFHVLQQRASLHGSHSSGGEREGELGWAEQGEEEEQQQQQEPPAAEFLPPPLPSPAPQQPQLLSDVTRLRPGFSCVTLPRSEFRCLVTQCLRNGDDVLLQQHMEDFTVACSLKEARSSITVLLCGTSGTGKSTLASLLASRLGITSVVSTDSIRHMMRSFASEAEDPLLWGSTYQAGEVLGRMAGAAGYARYGDPRKAAIKGYKAQSEMVVDHLDRLITSCEARRESLLVEGVHLSLNFVVRLMQRHPTIVPFLVHISNEAKHMERFAVRAKAMTLRAEANRYVKYLRTIRVIQDYLCKAADKHAVPKVDNTNVDRSIATIHATVLGCLRRRAQGETMLEAGSQRCKVVLEEYLRCRSATWSSRDMLDLIRRKSAAVGGGSSPSDGPSTSAASTPKGPLSLTGDAALNDNRSFYGHDSASSDNGSSSGGGKGSRGAGAGSSTGSEEGTAAAGRQQSCPGSVLDIDGRSDDD